MPNAFMTIAEVDPFPATAARVGLAEDERQELVSYLALNPTVGDVIIGTGGLRKLRWAGRSKGKRGGYRVIYYFFNESLPLYLLAVYPKNQQVDLTSDQRRRLTALATELKAVAT